MQYTVHDFYIVSPSTCHIQVIVKKGASFLHTVVVTSSCEIWRRFSPTLRFSSNVEVEVENSEEMAIKYQLQETESAGVAGAAAGPPPICAVRPGVVRRPWRAAWGRPPAVKSGLGPSAGSGERPGAVRRPRRATWGRPPAAVSGLGPSVGCGVGINVLKINGNNTMNF